MAIRRGLLVACMLLSFTLVTFSAEKEDVNTGEDIGGLAGFLGNTGTGSGIKCFIGDENSVTQTTCSGKKSCKKNYYSTKPSVYSCGDDQVESYCATSVGLDKSDKGGGDGYCYCSRDLCNGQIGRHNASKIITMVTCLGIALVVWLK